MTAVLVTDRHPGREAHRPGADGKPNCGGYSTTGWHTLDSSKAAANLDGLCREQGCYPAGVIDQGGPTHSWRLHVTAVLEGIRERFSTPEQRPGWEEEGALAEFLATPSALDGTWSGPKHTAPQVSAPSMGRTHGCTP